MHSSCKKKWLIFDMPGNKRLAITIWYFPKNNTSSGSYLRNHINFKKIRGFKNVNVTHTKPLKTSVYLTKEFVQM